MNYNSGRAMYNRGGFFDSFSFGHQSTHWFLWIFVIVMIWSLIWKGLALWKSARNDDRYWFLAFLLVHTLGVLEILYLFVFAKTKFVLVSEPKNTRIKPRRSAKSKK